MSTPITESKVWNSTLTIDSVSYACQHTNVRLVPSTETDGDPLPVICGQELPAEETDSYVLAITSIQDFTDPAGFQRMTWDKHGTSVPFVWTPAGPSGPTFSGNVRVRRVEIGGEARRRLTVEVEWPATDVTPAWTTVPA